MPTKRNLARRETLPVEKVGGLYEYLYMRIPWYLPRYHVRCLPKGRY